MPSGKVHTACSLTIAGASFGALLFVAPEAAVPCAAGALAGVLIGPDWDVDNGYIGMYYVRKYFKLLYWPYRIIIWPYAKVCSHRGLISHSPGLSTIIRLIYLGLWILPFYLYFGWEWKVEAWMLWGVFGLFLSDTAHFLLDQLDVLLGGGL